jgi:hypothetical protein
MSEKLKQFINKRIERMEIIHDYVQLFFTDGAILNIFNPYSIIGVRDPKIVGYGITAVKQDQEAITLFLLPEGSIKVSRLDSDYRGPEAMEYIGKDGRSVVWQ